MNKKNALLSVYHKDGIADFARELVALGWRIISSGGTAKALRDASIPVTDVAEISGLPAILGHRVVTLVPQIHGGLLATEEHAEELEGLGYPWIDLACVDLYPLKEEISKPGATRQSVIEKTDIGGPTMIRSAAKGRRIVIVDPADRGVVIEWLKSSEPDSNEFRNRLAAKAEGIVAEYCLASARYHSAGAIEGMIGTRVATCKYGENAWQTPAHVYQTDSDCFSPSSLKVIEGTAASYNNRADMDRMLQTVTHIAEALRVNKHPDTAIAVGVKHGNACGAAVGNDSKEVLQKMITGDTLSIMGGLVMCNFAIDGEHSEVLTGRMLDGIAAPSFTDEAIANLRRRGDKCRFVANPELSKSANRLDQRNRLRYIRAGFMIQPNYTFVLDLTDPHLVKYGQATPAQERDMLLAWAVGSTSNSNTITIVKGGQLIGNGVAQQDRVGAAALAIERVTRKRNQDDGHDVRGAVAYSDSFFPFDDGPKTLIKPGVTAVITSSGSVRDEDTIRAFSDAGVILYMIPDAVGRGFFGH